MKARYIVVECSELEARALIGAGACGRGKSFPLKSLALDELYMSIGFLQMRLDHLVAELKRREAKRTR